MNIRIILACALLVASVSKALSDEHFGESTFEAAPVSIFELLVSGEKFDGWRVQVRGFANFEFEGALLFATRDAFEQYDTSSAIVISLRDSTIEPIPSWSELGKYSGSYVIIEGEFKNFLRSQGSPDLVFRIGPSAAGELHTINSISVTELLR